MALPPSTANWHWKTKYVAPWARTWFEQELTTLRVKGDGEEEVAVDEVTEVEGDVELGQRKSKLITIYDCQIALKWSGTASDGTKVEGSLTIPEVSHENSIDGLSDYVFDWKLSTTSSGPVNNVFELAKSKLRVAIETKLAEFPSALIDTHGKDLTVSSEPSRATSPSNNSPSTVPASTTAPTATVNLASKPQVINTETIVINANFQASANDLFGILTDEKRIPTWSRAAAQSKAEVGSEFSLFGGGVTGVYIRVIPGKEVVQSWKLNSPTWPAGHVGTLTTTFDQGSDFTKLTLSLAGVPKGYEDEIRHNLEGYYIGGLKSIGNDVVGSTVERGIIYMLLNVFTLLSYSIIMPVLHTIQKVFLRPYVPYRLHNQVRLLHTPKCNKFNTLRHLAAVHPRIAIRTAASTVSHKPGSQTLPHAAQNIREETGNSASDLAKTIAGNVPIPESMDPGRETFLGYTSLVASKVPPHILHMGLAGGLPYVGTGLASAYFARQAGEAAAGLVSSVDPTVALTLLQDCLHIQVTYGAVLLSFTGALHWGMEMAGYNGFKGYPRVLLGALPVIYGWSTLALDPMYALMAQWAGFTGMWYVDMKATSAAWTPKWYSQYRFYLSILVGTCIIGTLAATSYFGPAPGHDAVTHNLDIIRQKRRLGHGDFANEVKGSIEAVPAGVDADAYVKIQKKPEPKPEEQKE